MKKIIVTAAMSAALAQAAPAQTARVWLEPQTGAVTDTPAATTGVHAVIVAENTAGRSVVYRPQGHDAVIWQRYSSLGAGYAEDVAYTRRDDGTIAISAEDTDMGYVITEGSSQYCFWLTDYSRHRWDVSSVDVESADCDRVYLHVGNPAGDIAWYTIAGRRMTVDRDIQLSYTSLAYNEDDNVYSTESVTETYASLSETVSAPVPLCDTQFTLSPDRFARQWGIGSDLATGIFITEAVQARSKAEQTARDADNEQHMETELGGSAPCEITFSAAVTDAAVYRRWEISASPEFTDALYTYDQTEFTFTFTEAGTFYVRFTADNSAGTCAYTGDTYNVSIGDSRLECPNAFSPGTSEGVNDEWKVSYRSIVSFDCHIFNRWGNEMAHLTDPSQGWDGRYGGKLVPAGVYYYVIKARGSDGKEYNLSGDINIIGSRRDTTGAAPAE